MSAVKLLFYSSTGVSLRWLEALKRYLPAAEIEVYGEAPIDWQADYALVWKAPTELFQGQRRLRGIFNLGAGVDSLLATPQLPPGVPIYKLRDAGMAAWMLDYVRYGLLHFGRDMDRYRLQQKDRQWRPYGVRGRSHWPVGVMGLGAIGSQVAAKLSAEGYPVMGWSRQAKSIAGVESFAGDAELERFLSRTRALVSILPSTPETRRLLNRERLSALPEGAVVISCGRGEVLDTDALLELLDGDHLRGALLDVFESEPLAADSPLYDSKKVLITPHISAPTPIDSAAQQIARNIEQLQAGESLESVDPERGY
ncbi:2-hydroxyacid dehydrogenase [Aestuariirhabdus sp. LZHN29]|uniref:2-hydroxyacid dehydrogenase n=1 Tax=Aestuariirhabdus sp. LZHN29 TaxID=3417462 RepID=UPI003CE6A1A3